MKRRYAVIGDPVSHSLSPVIHQGWMSDHGIDASYEAICISPEALEASLEKLRSEDYQGLNVTLPHKEGVLALSASCGPEAKLIGVANTLSRKAVHGWHADNTDLAGFETGLSHALRAIDPALADNRPVLVLGAGGASRAVAAALARQGYSATYCNRSAERAEVLASIHKSVRGSVSNATTVPFDDLADAMRACAFIVNATSLGHSGRSVSWVPGEGRLVYDLSYGEAGEAFLAPAGEAGWRTADGLGMLVAQAAQSFRIWFGIQPDFDKGLARAAARLAGKTP